MKKTSIIMAVSALSAFSAVSCTERFEKYNTNEYALQESTPDMLLPTMVSSMMNVQTGRSQMCEQMIGSLGGYFAISSRFGGQNFDTFNASDAYNASAYSSTFLDIYANYFLIEKKTEGKGHFFAIARIARAAAMMRMADMYGPIPYSKVNDGAMYVEYDSLEDVYRGISEDLLWAVEELGAFVAEFPDARPFARNDRVYGGDYRMWMRLANSLRLRVAVRTGDGDGFAEIMAHPAGLVEDNSHNAMIEVGTSENPYYKASVSWQDLRINSSITDYMNGYEDPRRPYYFTTCTFGNRESEYIGMRIGEASFDKSAVTPYSLPAFGASDPVALFVAAETSFLKAEAALRGWIPGDVKEFYEKGIRLSMEQYGVSAEDVEAYISDSSRIPADHVNDPRGNKYDYDRKSVVTVAWDQSADSESMLERIITQKWIAMYPMGLEAWADFRRTGYPELAPSMDNLSGGVITDMSRGMRRLRYPYTEKSHNESNYNAAVNSYLGGKDDESVDLFWALDE